MFPDSNATLGGFPENHLAMLVLSNQLSYNFLLLDLIDELDGPLNGVEQSYLELDRRIVTPMLQK